MQDSTKSASATVNVVAPGQVAATANVHSGELHRQSDRARQCVRAVWHRHELRTNHMDATGTHGRRGGQLVRRRNEGKHVVPHERCGAVRRRLAIHGSRPHVHNRRVPSSTGAGDNGNNDGGDDTTERCRTVGFDRFGFFRGGLLIWTATFCGLTTRGSAVSRPNPIKLLPNGHFLINFSGQPADGTNSVLQEVDLTGKLIWQMTAADLNKALAAATCAGCNITVIGTHHDFEMLSQRASDRAFVYTAGHFRHNCHRRRNHRSRPKPQSGLALERIRPLGRKPPAHAISRLDAQQCRAVLGR